MPKRAWVLGLLFISSLAEARWYQPEHAELGKPLYEKHCASCHGAQAEGAKNWTERQADGRSTTAFKWFCAYVASPAA